MLGDFLGLLKISILTKTGCCNYLSRFGGKLGYFFIPTSGHTGLDVELRKDRWIDKRKQIG